MARKPYVSLPQEIRDPVKVRAGRIGARTRWGVPRFVRLNGLTSEQREFVIETVNELRRAAESRHVA